jgi:hypothetical protein
MPAKAMHGFSELAIGDCECGVASSRSDVGIDVTSIMLEMIVNQGATRRVRGRFKGREVVLTRP